MDNYLNISSIVLFVHASLFFCGNTFMRRENVIKPAVYRFVNEFCPFMFYSLPLLVFL